MADIILNAHTEQQIAAFIAKPSHALVLEGIPGSGKRTVAQYIVRQLLGENSPYFIDISSDGSSSISIDTIREVEKQLTLKVPNHNAINRIILIENSQLMTLEAQNALLKNLEEPPEGTILLLTASYRQALLPTIMSRATTITVKMPARLQVDTFFLNKGHTDTAIKQALLSSGGLPGLMTALLSDDDHPLKLATIKARSLLTSSRYQRLIESDELVKNKLFFIDVLTILQQMAHIRLSLHDRNIEQWSNILEASYDATKALNQNAQTKLVVDKLLLSI